MQFVTKERDNGLETGVALLAAFARWSRASTSNWWARIGRKHPRLPFGNEEANRIQRGRRGCTAPLRAKSICCSHATTPPRIDMRNYLAMKPREAPQRLSKPWEVACRPGHRRLAPCWLRVPDACDQLPFDCARLYATSDGAIVLRVSTS